LPRCVVVLALVAAAIAAGCGGSETTTVIKEAPTTTVEKTTTVEVPAAKPKPVADPEPAADPESKMPVPDVVGLPLDLAEAALKNAGYKAAATNTDTTFGIIVPETYTVCTQDEARGNLVPLLAQKYGC